MRKWFVIAMLFVLAGTIVSCQLLGDSSPTPVAKEPETVESTVDVEVAVTKKPTEEVIKAETVRATNTPKPPTPSPTPTPTPIPTITPNIPVDNTDLVFASAPKASVFLRPAPVVPPQLSFVNESDFNLQISIVELGRLIPVFKNSFSNIQVAPGQYNYKVAWGQEGTPVLADVATLAAGEWLTITITSRNVSALAFENQTTLEIVVSLPELGETFRVAPGSTSEERPLPLGEYTYVVEAIGSAGASLIGEADLDPNKLTTIVIEETALLISELVVQNDTDFELRLTLNGISDPIVVPPRQTSEPRPMSPGEYTYQVSAGGATNTDQVSIAPNETALLTFDLQTVIPDVGGLKFVNQTGSTISITINGVAGVITLGPNETSADTQLPPGTYQYTVEAGNFAPYTSEAPVEKGFVQEVTLKLGGSRAEVKVKNRTNCSLTISFSGPDSLSMTILPGQTDTAKLQQGTYSYNVRACNASGNYTENFSGSSEIEFSLR